MCSVDFGIGETIFAVVSIVTALTSTAISVTSALQQSEAAEAESKYHAQVAAENAKIAEENAAMERQQGIEEERLQRLKTRQAVGAQQTAMAANGIDVTQGSALDVIEDTATMGELDALQTRYNYERRALAYEQEANNLNNKANLDTIAGQNAAIAGTMNAFSTGLAGLSKTADVASKWYSYSGKTTNSISWGKDASGMKIGTSRSGKVYAPFRSGLS